MGPQNTSFFNTLLFQLFAANAQVPEPITLFGTSTNDIAPEPEIPLLFGHRGDKINLPEHTIPAYEMAMASAIDYIEPDLVLTKDQVPVCFHDIFLHPGTDVKERPEFDHLKTTNRTIKLRDVTHYITSNWLVSNFTWAELKTLRVIQKAKGIRPKYFDRMFGIPSFDEFMEIAHRYTWKQQFIRNYDGRKRPIIGLMPELKHARYHDAIGGSQHYMVETIVKALEKWGYSRNEKAKPSRCLYNGTEIPCNPMLVQALDPVAVEYLRNTTTYQLLCLMDTANLRWLTYKGMAEMKGKTDWLCFLKSLLFTGTPAQIKRESLVDWNKTEIEELGGFIKPNKIVPYAKKLGFKVAVHTIYSSWEDSERGCAVRCTNETKEQEMHYFFKMGVNGFFVEGIEESIKIRQEYFGKKLISKWGMAGANSLFTVDSSAIACNFNWTAFTANISKGDNILAILQASILINAASALVKIRRIQSFNTVLELIGIM
ncbi:unnamed protein product [Orchesella dallaii]|uniref:glycerophosphodiester phosphodiesterase n=1 Tax=Orchesella dallaii TaxID=48710 RepID=A0ABP1RGX0_9HEXA